MTEEAAKGLSLIEMRLLSDFSNTVSARIYNNNVTVEKLVLSYDNVNGFTIELVETPKQVGTLQVPTTST